LPSGVYVRTPEHLAKLNQTLEQSMFGKMNGDKDKLDRMVKTKLVKTLTDKVPTVIRKRRATASEMRINRNNAIRATLGIIVVRMESGTRFDTRDMVKWIGRVRGHMVDESKCTHYLKERKGEVGDITFINHKWERK
jgi:hypothetical protein